MAQLEIFDGTNWIQLGGQTNIALTGAVIGNGSSSIATTLNNYQTMVGSTLSFNWSNNGQFQEYSIYHYLQDSTPPPQFVETIQAGTYAANTYRWWNLIFQPGLSSSPSGNFQIDFVHNVSGRKTPFKITSIGSGFTTYLSSTLDMGSNQINNLPLPTLSNQPATKGYVDSLITNQFQTSIWMSNFGFWLRAYSDTNHGMLWDSVVDGPQFRGYNGFRWCIGNSGVQEIMRLTGDRLSLNIGLTITGKFSLGLNYGYLNPSGNVGTATYQINNYSIDCTDRIKASEFNAYSSIKKKIILAKSKDIEKEVETIFSKIPLFKYEYKDKIKEGASINYGVIAESLNEVLPDYVDMKSYDFVPNIMSKVNIKKLKDGYYKIKINKANVDITSTKLRILTNTENIDAEIIKIDKNIIIISSDKPLRKEEFIYGTYEACPTVSKQKLFELSMIVIQNLIKRIEKLENKSVRELNE